MVMFVRGRLRLSAEPRWSAGLGGGHFLLHLFLWRTF